MRDIVFMVNLGGNDLLPSISHYSVRKTVEAYFLHIQQAFSSSSRVDEVKKEEAFILCEQKKKLNTRLLAKLISKEGVPSTQVKDYIDRTEASLMLDVSKMKTNKWSHPKSIVGNTCFKLFGMKAVWKVYPLPSPPSLSPSSSGGESLFESQVYYVDKKSGKSVLLGEGRAINKQAAEIEASLDAVKGGSVLERKMEEVEGESEYEEWKKKIAPSPSHYFSSLVPFLPKLSPLIQDSILNHLSQVVWAVEMMEGNLVDYHLFYPHSFLPHIRDYLSNLMSLPPSLSLPSPSSLLHYNLSHFTDPLNTNNNANNANNNTNNNTNKNTNNNANNNTINNTNNNTINNTINQTYTQTNNTITHINSNYTFNVNTHLPFPPLVVFLTLLPFSKFSQLTLGSSGLRDFPFKSEILLNYYSSKSDLLDKPLSLIHFIHHVTMQVEELRESGKLPPSLLPSLSFSPNLSHVWRVVHHIAFKRFNLVGSTWLVCFNCSIFLGVYIFVFSQANNKRILPSQFPFSPFLPFSQPFLPSLFRFSAKRG